MAFESLNWQNKQQRHYVLMLHTDWMSVHVVCMSVLVLMGLLRTLTASLKSYRSSLIQVCALDPDSMHPSSTTAAS